MIWCCPQCRGQLRDDAEALRCTVCNTVYPVVGGIPDLRAPDLLRPEHLEDRARAERLACDVDRCSVEELIGRIFDRPGYWTPDMAAARVRRTLGQPIVMREDVRGWLSAAVPANGTFLDVGCGLGGLLSAAALEGRHGAGVDQSLHLLLVARRVIAKYGGNPVLAAAFGERLPLTDGAVAGITMQDVFEHVDSKAAVLREASRVLTPGGVLALVMPNRFSIAAEPHVHLWGVGWLPRALQRRYVWWRRRDPYDHTVLPSVWEVARLLRRNTPDFTYALEPAPIPDGEIAHFARRRVALARAYNLLLRKPFTRQLQLYFGPSLRVVAWREPPQRAPSKGRRSDVSLSPSR